MHVSPDVRGQLANPFIPPPGNASPTPILPPSVSKPGIDALSSAAPRVVAEAAGQLVRVDARGSAGVPTQPITVTDRPPALDAAELHDIVRAVRDDDFNSKAKPYIDVLPRKIVQRVFDAKDTDRDNRLSIEEFGAKTQQLRRFDVDGDGFLTARELHDGLQNRLEDAFKQHPLLNPNRWAQRWLDALDIDASGDLSPAETSFDPATFQKIDADANGLLTPGEVTDDLTTRLPAIDVRSHLEEMARSLGERLDQAGFADRPPTNVRELVHSLGLDARASSILMRALADRYPHGLGISLLG